ncbi:MAG: hypothetical protein K1X74_12605 [Pirellulales bacterium]|nr:hypothetical protein [Pirellulales bacterium]
MSRVLVNIDAASPADPAPAVEAYTLGAVEYESALALQHRLVYECTGRDDGQIALLLCEHEPIVTIGRHGSRAHIRYRDDELRAQGLPIRWVNRGGGCLWHGPGQLAVYPIVPLRFYGLSVGAYLDRFLGSLYEALLQLKMGTLSLRGRRGIWGRTGQLVAVGASVKYWTTYHGAIINVGPTAAAWRGIQADPQSNLRMSSLVAERQQAVKMAALRSAVIDQFARAMGIERVHLYTGHPLLRAPRPVPAAHVAHAS